MKKLIVSLAIFFNCFNFLFSQTKTTHSMEKGSSNQSENLGLLVLLKAQEGKAEELREFLISAQPLVEQEAQTLSWYAFQLDEQTFGIFDTFEKEAGRQAHLKGKVAEALVANAEHLLASTDLEKAIQPVEILAAQNEPTRPEHLGLLVKMKAQSGKEAELETFLKSGLSLVQQEKDTRAWYAFKIGADTYAIFDTFAQEAGRQAHLKGEVAKALLEQAPNLLNGFAASDIQSTSILAKK